MQIISFTKLLLISIYLALPAISFYGYSPVLFQNNFGFNEVTLNSSTTQNFTLTLNWLNIPQNTSCDAYIFKYNATSTDVIFNQNFIASKKLVTNQNSSQINFTADSNVWLKMYCVYAEQPNSNRNVNQIGVLSYNVSVANFQQQFSQGISFDTGRVNLPIENLNPCLMVIQTYPQLNQLASQATYFLYAPNIIPNSTNYAESISTDNKAQHSFTIHPYMPGNWTIIFVPSNISNINSKQQIHFISPLSYPNIKNQQFCWNNCTQIDITYKQHMSQKQKIFVTQQYQSCYYTKMKIDNVYYGFFQVVAIPNSDVLHLPCSGKIKTDIYDEFYCKCQNQSNAFSPTDFCTSSCNLILFVNKNDTKNVSQGCTCQNKFQWNSQNRTCEINCTAFSGAKFLTPYFNRTMCGCIDPKYRWNAYSYKCVLDCRTISRSTYKKLLPSFTDTNEMFVCPCQNGYLWNTTVKDCVVCSNDPNIDWTQSVTSANQCKCKYNLIWDSVRKICSDGCSNYANTDLSQISTQSGICFCKVGFYWSINVCRRNCSTIQNTNSSLFTNIPTECVCNYGFNWNPQTNKCDINCLAIQNVNLSQLNTFILLNQCPCVNNFYWNSTQFGCRRNCTNVLNVNQSLFSANLNQCVCKNGYFWSSSEGLCRRNCASLPYTNIAKTPSNPNICFCTYGFIWNGTMNLCVANCQSISYSNGLNTANPSKCLCKYMYGWDSVYLQCRLLCDYVNWWDLIWVNCMWQSSLSSANPNTQTKQKNIQTQTQQTQNQNTQQINSMQNIPSNQNNKKILIIVLCSVFGSLIVLSIVEIIIYRKYKKNKQNNKDGQNVKEDKSDKAESMKTIMTTEMGLGLNETVKVEQK